MSQRVRRLSAAGGEERRDGDSPEERGGDLGGGEKREERRRQAQLLQIHRELQNVEVILFWSFSRPKNRRHFFRTALRFCASASFHFSVSVRSEEKLAFLRPTFLEFVPRCSTRSSSAALAAHGGRLSKPRLIPIKEAQARKAR